MVNEISSRLAGEALDETLQIQFSPVAEGTSKTLTVRVALVLRAGYQICWPSKLEIGHITACSALLHYF